MVNKMNKKCNYLIICEEIKVFAIQKGMSFNEIVALSKELARIRPSNVNLNELTNVAIKSNLVIADVIKIFKDMQSKAQEEKIEKRKSQWKKVFNRRSTINPDKTYFNDVIPGVKKGIVGKSRIPKNNPGTYRAF